MRLPYVIRHVISLLHAVPQLCCALLQRSATISGFTKNTTRSCGGYTTIRLRFDCATTYVTNAYAYLCVWAAALRPKQAVGGRPPRCAPAPLLPPWAPPKRLAPPSRRQRSSSFPRPTRSHAHRCSRLTRQHGGGEQSGL